MPQFLKSCFLAFIVAVSACGVSNESDGGPGGDTIAPSSLVISPASTTLEATSGATATQEYSVAYTNEKGETKDVTSEVTLALTLPFLGSFQGSTFRSTANVAGRSQVTANYQGSTAQAEIAVLLTHTITLPGAEGASDLFANAAQGGVAPELVYPQSGILVPPNLNSLEFHYRPGAGNDIFEVEFVGALLRVTVYLRCTVLVDGCVFAPSEEAWSVLSQGSKGEVPLTYSVKGLDSRAASPSVGSSAVFQMQFSAEEMQGGIYYWKAKPGSIQRYDFGRRGQTAENFLSVAQTNGSQCVGCHALSRSGDRIAVGYDIPVPAGLQAFDVATRASLWGETGGLMGSGGANFSVFSPDSSQLLTAGTGPIFLRNSSDGSNKSEVIANGTMPDWAADNSAVVFAQGSAQTCSLPPPFCDFLPGAGGNPGVDGGSIIRVTPGNWTDETIIAPASGKNNYYPAFSPDSNWVVYDRSGANSYDAPDAQMWIVPAGGGSSIQLSRASPSPYGDSWPKWAPFRQTYDHGHSVMWLTFSSRRDYGLRIQNAGRPLEEQIAQLWMVGFDPDKAAAGQDGSFTAFWLPFQEVNSGNHIAQWVDTIERQPCGSQDCPSGEFCENGSCVPPVQ